MVPREVFHRPIVPSQATASAIRANLDSLFIVFPEKHSIFSDNDNVR